MSKGDERLHQVGTRAEGENYEVLRYLSQHFSALVYPVFLYGVVPPTLDK